MIKKVLFCIILIVAGFSFFNVEDHHSFSNTGGSPGGYTSSPGDANRTCRNCHGPGATPTKADLITTSVPAGGYIPGVTYNISLSYTETGRSKFGFEAVSENSAGVRKGQFIAVGSGQTRTIGTGAPRITHVSTAGSGGSKVWSFQWKAPAAGSGDITFYASVNASNANGNDDSGDNIYITETTINEDITAGVADYISELSNKVSIYPNPASEQIVVGVPTEFGDVSSVEIFDIQGSKKLHFDGNPEKISVAKLPTGSYLLLVNGEKSAVKRFVKQ